ncbi:MarR family transcriptional regulator [Nocardioides sp. CER19]|uniref:MarR family winged helix-turn-helix transcriptional regulator n=1 Tax=Nocardioides sp. CER19 TaxID=3038538 RepID=UPI00244D1A6F|nr:MarR family transcriptional regulator [Nocardioides sp. CER19]MDH2414233.1 MarR family transcriptional regulator [Nocardioides sp. CER19]
MPVSRVVQQPTWLLSRANARAQGLLYTAFAEEGLRPVHYRALAALDEHGEMSQAELGRQLGLDRKDVTVALDHLADWRLVRRRPDPADGRRNVVTLTTSGRELLPRLDSLLGDVQEQVLGPLSADQRALLVSLLARLDDTSPSS